MSVSLISLQTNEQFAKIITESFSIAEVEEKLGYNSYSGSVATKIRQRIAELNLDISHFKTQKLTKRNESNIFIENSTVSQRVLRDWYRKGKYTPYVCAICGQEPLWQGKELTLILDHINGHNHDDRLENLRWVCPNCNQQLDTTGSKNRAYKQEQSQVNRCIDCGAEINPRSTRCKSCAGKLKAKDNIPVERDELKSLIRTTSFVKIGEKFNVSDNAIRKWCIKYNLPSKVSDIKKISDSDWAKI